MEVKRSYLKNIISFYILLDNPDILNVSDAITVWSNRFKQRELKDILLLISDLLRNYEIDFNISDDKERAKSIIESYIRRIIHKINSNYIDIGKNETHCMLSEIELKFSLNNMKSLLNEYLRKLNDKNECRNKCKIDDFILKKYQFQINEYITNIDTQKNNKKRKPFVDIIKEIQNAMTNGFSCNTCEKIGDAIIALEADRTMQLEHLDNSFDHLCPIINQPHHKNISESAYIKNTKIPSTNLVAT